MFMGCSFGGTALLVLLLLLLLLSLLSPGMRLRLLPFPFRLLHSLGGGSVATSRCLPASVLLGDLSIVGGGGDPRVTIPIKKEFS